MKQSVLVLGNSDSGLYDFRKEVLMALMQESRGGRYAGGAHLRNDV